MAIDQIATSLLRIPLLAGLTPTQIAEIGRRAPRCAFRRGEVITQAGTPGDCAYLILSGEAACRTGSRPRTTLEAVAPGSLIGELAMFIEHVYGATVVALGWVDCLKLERATLHAQLRADPDLADRLARVVRGRLTMVATELQVIDRLLASSINQCDEAPRRLLAIGRPASQGMASMAR